MILSSCFTTFIRCNQLIWKSAPWPAPESHGAVPDSLAGAALSCCSGTASPPHSTSTPPSPSSSPRSVGCRPCAPWPVHRSSPHPHKGAMFEESDRHRLGFQGGMFPTELVTSLNRGQYTQQVPGQHVLAILLVGFFLVCVFFHVLFSFSI